jgi:hypothetical protein
MNGLLAQDHGRAGVLRQYLYPLFGAVEIAIVFDRNGDIEQLTQIEREQMHAAVRRRTAGAASLSRALERSNVGRPAEAVLDIFLPMVGA